MCFMLGLHDIVSFLKTDLLRENVEFALLWDCISIENKNANYKKLKNDFLLQRHFFECEPSGHSITTNSMYPRTLKLEYKMLSDRLVGFELVCLPLHCKSCNVTIIVHIAKGYIVQPYYIYTLCNVTLYKLNKHFPKRQQVTHKTEKHISCY